MGRDDVFEAGGSNYRRLTYTLRALIIATYPTQAPGDPVPFDITLKLTLSDPNLSNTMSQTLAVDSMPCIRAPHQQFIQIALDDGAIRQRQRGPLRLFSLPPRLWSSIQHGRVSTPHLEGRAPTRGTWGAATCLTWRSTLRTPKQPSPGGSPHYQRFEVIGHQTTGRSGLTARRLASTS